MTKRTGTKRALIGIALATLLGIFAFNAPSNADNADTTAFPADTARLYQALNWDSTIAGTFAFAGNTGASEALAGSCQPVPAALGGPVRSASVPAGSASVLRLFTEAGCTIPAVGFRTDGQPMIDGTLSEGQAAYAINNATHYRFTDI